MDTASAGGFLYPTLPSPPASSITSPSNAGETLPHPREHPLRQGGAKETSFIQYVDRAILNVTRRYAKKFSGKDDAKDSVGGVKGYERFGEAAADMEKLVDVVWISGTPTLQTPYLLSLALLLTSYLPSFPPAPKAMFHLLRKLDFAFASLLQGRDVDTGARLPGFETGRGVSVTEKVRIKSLVERSRVVVVDVMRRSEGGETDPDDSAANDTGTERNDDDEDTDTGMNVDDDAYDEGPDSWDMEVARVYDRTIVELGETLASDT